MQLKLCKITKSPDIHKGCNIGVNFMRFSFSQYLRNRSTSQSRVLVNQIASNTPTTLTSVYKDLSSFLSMAHQHLPLCIYGPISRNIDQVAISNVNKEVNKVIPHNYCKELFLHILSSQVIITHNAAVVYDFSKEFVVDIKMPYWEDEVLVLDLSITYIFKIRNLFVHVQTI